MTEKTMTICQRVAVWLGPAVCVVAAGVQMLWSMGLFTFEPGTPIRPMVWAAMMHYAKVWGLGVGDPADVGGGVGLLALQAG